MKKPTVIIIEDEPKIARWIRTYFERADYTAVVYHDGRQGLAAVRHRPPDLLILDLNLPGVDGLDVCRALRRDPQPPVADVPIIMLTARVEEADKLAGLEIGADDYITKPFSPKELLARAHALLRRMDRLRRPTTHLHDNGLLVDVDGRRATLHGRALALTPTEFALLAVLLENKGVALTRAQLIEHALGHDYEGQERTIDVHVRQLRRKIEPDPQQPQRITTVFGVGYRYA